MHCWRTWRARLETDHSGVVVPRKDHQLNGNNNFYHTFSHSILIEFSIYSSSSIWVILSSIALKFSYDFWLFSPKRFLLLYLSQSVHTLNILWSITIKLITKKYYISSGQFHNHTPFPYNSNDRLSDPVFIEIIHSHSLKNWINSDLFPLSLYFTVGCSV